MDLLDCLRGSDAFAGNKAVSSAEALRVQLKEMGCLLLMSAARLRSSAAVPCAMPVALAIGPRALLRKFIHTSSARRANDINAPPLLGR